MTDYLTEQEQVELLKAWFKQYGLLILSVVVLVGFSILGWHYWQQKKKTHLHEAVVLYSTLLKTQSNDALLGKQQANLLLKRYADTPYGSMGAFWLAHQAVQKKEYSSAQQYLAWVMKHEHDRAIRQIARLRLSRILIEIHQLTQALHTLDDVDDTQFNGLISEVRGDAYLAMNNFPMARQAYHRALLALPHASIINPLLQIKYDACQ